MAAKYATAPIEKMLFPCRLDNKDGRSRVGGIHTRTIVTKSEAKSQ